MSARIGSFAAAALVGLAQGCVDTGQALVDYPAYGRGVEAEVLEVDGWQVDLVRAELALGPVYFCATRAASADLCPVAVNELTEVGSIDLLDDNRTSLGDVHGVTGTLGSATFDYGITWLPTESRPTAKEGTVEGHSLVLEGTATQDDRQMNFRGVFDLAPPRRGGNVVDGHPVDVDVTEDASGLLVEVDVERFVVALDFEELAAVPDDPVVVMPGMRSYEAMVIALTANAQPTFTWEFDP